MNRGQLERRPVRDEFFCVRVVLTENTKNRPWPSDLMTDKQLQASRPRGSLHSTRWPLIQPRCAHTLDTLIFPPAGPPCCSGSCVVSPGSACRTSQQVRNRGNWGVGGAGLGHTVSAMSVAKANSQPQSTLGTGLQSSQLS